MHSNASVVVLQQAVSEWGGLAKEEDDVADEEDQDLQVALNELCTKFLRALLSEDIQRVGEQLGPLCV